MKPRVFLSVLCVMFLVPMARAETSSEVEVTITPLRAAYHVGEPVAALLVIKNTADEDLRVNFSYPGGTNLRLTAMGNKVPIVGESPFPRTEAGFRRFAPKMEAKYAIALNRYLVFTTPDQYSVTYTASYHGKIVPIPGQEGKGMRPSYKARGEFAIRIHPGPIDQEWIKELIAIVEERDVSAVKPGDDEKPKLTRDEAVELLLWAETPDVIEPLVAAAKAFPKWQPTADADIVRSLEKFFKQHERARDGILEIGIDRGEGAFAAALTIYEKEGITISGSRFNPILTSQPRQIGKTWMSLEYLKKHGTSDDVVLLEPLTKDENEQIAGLAAAVVKKLRVQPPDTTPRATRPNER